MGCAGGCGPGCCGDDDAPIQVGNGAPRLVGAAAADTFGGQVAFAYGGGNMLSLAQATGRTTPLSLAPDVIRAFEGGSLSAVRPLLPMGLGGEGGQPGIPVPPPPLEGPRCDPHNILVSFEDASHLAVQVPPLPESDPPASDMATIGLLTSLQTLAGPTVLRAQFSAKTSPKGFNLYALLSVSGLRLEYCHWRQVFYEDTKLERWDIDGTPVPASAPMSHATESGKFATPRKRGDQDWYKPSASEKTTDNWTLTTGRWVDLTLYLRQQVAPKEDKPFKEPWICKDFQIHWTNRYPDKRHGGLATPRQTSKRSGREDFAGASGTLTMTSTFKRGAACAV